MGHHLKESKGVQQFRFWILIEIVMICITVVVPTIFLLARHFPCWRDVFHLTDNDRGLDDDTKIGEHTWKEKKAEVLPVDYREFKNKTWYSNLSDDDKDLLDQLRRKQ